MYPLISCRMLFACKFRKVWYVHKHLDLCILLILPDKYLCMYIYGLISTWPTKEKWNFFKNGDLFFNNSRLLPWYTWASDYLTLKNRFFEYLQSRAQWRRISSFDSNFCLVSDFFNRFVAKLAWLFYYFCNLLSN